MPIVELPNGVKVVLETADQVTDFLRKSALLPPAPAPASAQPVRPRIVRPPVVPVSGEFTSWTPDLARRFFAAIHPNAQKAFRMILDAGPIGLPTRQVGIRLGMDGRVAGGIAFSADNTAKDMHVPNPLSVKRVSDREKRFELDPEFARAAKEARLAAA